MIVEIVIALCIGFFIGHWAGRKDAEDQYKPKEPQDTGE